MRTEALDCVEVPKNAYLLRIHYESAGLMFLEEEVAAGGEGVRWKVATGYFGYRSQLRAARLLVGWTQEELARKSGIERLVITRYENSTTKNISFNYLEVMSLTFKEAGVTLLNNGEHGAGVRWTSPQVRVQPEQRSIYRSPPNLPHDSMTLVENATTA
jgi:transcriptional regulator with XRE-family HTH domain